MQDATADETRLEHVWVLLAGELLREASRSAASSQLPLVVKAVGSMLGDKLQSLCKFYDDKAEQDAVDALAASLHAVAPKAQSSSVSDAMNLWQADDVRLSLNASVPLQVFSMAPLSAYKTQKYVVSAFQTLFVL